MSRRAPRQFNPAAARKILSLEGKGGAGKLLQPFAFRNIERQLAAHDTSVTPTDPGLVAAQEQAGRFRPKRRGRRSTVLGSQFLSDERAGGLKQALGA